MATDAELIQSELGRIKEYIKNNNFRMAASTAKSLAWKVNKTDFVADDLMATFQKVSELRVLASEVDRKSISQNSYGSDGSSTFGSYPGKDLESFYVSIEFLEDALYNRLSAAKRQSFKDPQ